MPNSGTVVEFTEQIKRLRRARVPLVVIETEDAPDTVRKINGMYQKLAIMQWDKSRGLMAVNEPAVDIVNKLLQGKDARVATGSPAEFLAKIYDFKKSLIIMHNAHRFLTDAGVVQAVANLRDRFKEEESACTLVMLAPSVQLPAELKQDVVVIEDPLPTVAEIEAITKNICDGVGMFEVTDMGKISDTLIGLSAFSAEQTLATCVFMTAEEKADIDRKALWERKCKAIEQTQGLSIWRGGESFADIGGCDNVKTFMTQLIGGRRPPRAVVFIDEVEKSLAGIAGDTSGVSQDQLGTLLSFMQDNEVAGTIFIGPPGCLAGDTVVSYRRGKRNSGRELTLETLYKKFNNLPVGGKGTGNSVPWHKKTHTYLHTCDTETGVVSYKKIKAVIRSGSKKCITVITRYGKTITLTPDHLMLTPSGYVQAGNLQRGDALLCRGSMKATKCVQKSDRLERVIVRNLPYYSSGRLKPVTEPSSGVTYQYREQVRARLVIEAAMNKMTYEEYLTALRAWPWAILLKTLPSEMEVHHMNGDSLDDRLENLEVLSKPEHAKKHNQRANFSIEYTTEDHVLKIIENGYCQTYDIEMEDPHNFSTADGIFVHNCAKSAIAKAAGNEGNIPTISLDFGAMKNALVGKSGEQTRQALRIIQSISQGRTLFIATCNSISALPPELRRRFTMGTFFFDLPNKREREAIWKIYEEKYKVSGKRPDDAGWTGAEIKQCCFLASEVGISLEEASGYIVPVSVSAKEHIQELRKMASGKFISAGKPGLYTATEVPPPRTVAGRKIDLSKCDA